MTLAQAILVAMWYGCTVTCFPIFPWMSSFGGVFSGMAVGAILGDPITGLIVGATIQAMYIGVLNIGLSVPADANTAIIFGTAFAIALGIDSGEAVTLAVPFAVIGAFIHPFRLTVGTIWYSRITASFQKRKIGQAYAWVTLGGIINFSLVAVMAFVALYYGQIAFEAMFNAIPAWATNGMSVIGKTMQALGISLGVTVLSNKKNYLAYFLLAFFLVIVLGLSTLSMVIFTICILVIVSGFKETDSEKLDLGESEPASVNHSFKNGRLWLSAMSFMQFFVWGQNYNTFSAAGNLFAMVPVMKKLYPGDVDKQCEEILKYDCYYHTTPQFNGFVLGATIALEEERAAGVDIKGEDIIAIRTGLMGPLAGIGDPLMQAVIATIITSISVSMALTGSTMGAWFYCLVNLTIVFLFHLGGVTLVYKKGSGIIDRIVSSGILDRIMEAAKTVGLMAFGALAAQVVTVQLGITFNVGGVLINLQETLFDAIIGGIVPLTLCLTVIHFKRKGTNTLKMMLIMLVGAFICGAFGILV